MIPGIFVAVDDTGSEMSGILSEMDKITNEWTMKAARGECSWVCSDCCSVVAEGMPDTCVHDIQRCTDIIQRDKKHATITLIR